MGRAFLAIACLLLAACASLPPPNPRLVQHAPGEGYRFPPLEEGREDDRLFVILTFSGGGTRAAALAYGVLEALKDTKVQWRGRKDMPLLEEVDVISSVSGGSFTAAYYALHGNRIFDEFPEKFLYRKVQSELLQSALVPWNWPKLASSDYGRSDLAAEFYDREIFNGATYKDLIARNRRPFVILNATDMTSGAQFQFVQEYFDLLCSDLAGVPVARAVASSSAFPGLLTPLTFYNYAGSCGYSQPRWVELAANDHLDRVNPRRTARAFYWQSLAAPGPARPYLHLTDGGVADNIGLRGPLDAIASLDPSWSVLRRMNLRRVDKLVVIVVNAATGPETERDKKPDVPGLFDVLSTAATVPLGNYSFDTVEMLQSTVREFNQGAMLVENCIEHAARAQCTLRFPSEHKVELYPVQVAFEFLQSPEERHWFRNLSTTFELPRATVDELVKVGRRLLLEDPQFRRLLDDLKR